MEAKSSSVYSLIGLCQKAGKAISGGSMVEEAIRAGKAKLLIIAEDAGESMAKKFSDKANFYGVRMIYFGTAGKSWPMYWQGAALCNSNN